LPFCPNCGKEVPAIAAFCPNCGLALRPMSPVPGSGSFDHELSSGLDKLKNSFLFYMIGGAISLVPVVGSIGGILIFVALILLILAWRALGRSLSPSAQNFRSTGNWFLYSIIAAIIAGFVGAIILILYLVTALIPTFAAANPPNPNVVFQSDAFRTFLAGFFVIIAVVEIPIILSWNKMRASMRLLGTELSVPRIATAGVAFLVVALVGLVTVLGFGAALFTGAFSFPTTGSQPDFTSAYDSGAYYLVGAVSSLGILGAAYLGYTGVKTALEAPPRPASPTAPPQASA
jgi:hypothetical protein